MAKPEKNIGATWGWDIVVLALAVVVLCGPLLLNGPLPRGSDSFSTTHYLKGFMKAFGEGDYYPRWTDGTNQGLGAPSFVMFPPLAYYGAGLCSWLAGSVIGGIKLYFLLVSIFSGAAFYLLVRDWTGQGPPSAVAAAVYLLLPYHVLDMYQRFAMSETTAFIFFPLVILFTRRLLNGGSRTDFVGLSLGYAGLIYTHLVSAFLFSLLLGIWILWEAWGKWERLPVIGVSLACGILLAAPALVPAALEKSYVNIAWQREMWNGDFRMNFIFKDDVIPGLGFKDPVKPPVLKSAHSQLLLGLVAAAVGWSATQRRPRRQTIAVIASGLSLAYFLQLRLSTPVWLVIPELPTIQFPWRFQTMMVVLASLLAGFALSNDSGRPMSWSSAGSRFRRPGAILVFFLFALNLLPARQNAYLKPFDFDQQKVEGETVESWTEPAFTPVQFRQYKQFKRMKLTAPRVHLEGEGRSEVASWHSSERRVKISTPSGGKVTLGAFWFPGWEATLDGAPVEIRADEVGVIVLEVPPGEHDLSLRFRPTRVRTASAWLGGSALILTPLLAGLLTGTRRRVAPES